MRINRHDKRLDELLDKRVEIEFVDGDVKEGILGWNEHLDGRGTPRIKPQMYYLIVDLGECLRGMNIVSFRKGHVKSIRAL